MCGPVDGPLLKAVILKAKLAIKNRDTAAVWAGELLLRDTLFDAPILSDSQRLECLSLLGLSAQQNQR